MASELTRDDLKRFARLGAIRRLEELRREEAAIRSAFPELFRGGRASSAPAAANAGNQAPAARRRRPKMSAAARRAVSERMKKYWAERRKAKATRG